MPDRRVGDRRESQQKMIKIPFKSAVIYIILITIIIISVSFNIVLAIKNSKYKEKNELLRDLLSAYEFDEDEYNDGNIYYDEDEYEEYN